MNNAVGDGAHNEALTVACLQSIAKSLALLSANVPAPHYRRRLNEYAAFDWRAIAAQPTAKDGEGVSEVLWNNHKFVRRHATDKKKGEAIWFSRKLPGQGDSGQWAILISFKDYSQAE